MRLGSLFSGIGGFELVAEWCGHRTIWQSEIDPYCTALLAERFPGVPNLGDITKIDWRNVERPDIIAGGFPCQDISYSGRGAGIEAERSGLWYEYARAIRELGPRYVIVENVDALLRRGIDAVLGTLADLGYDAEWSVYGAKDVGAPHRRRRTWMLATITPAPGGREGVRDSSCGGLGGGARRRSGEEPADGRSPVPSPWDERRQHFARLWATEPDLDRVAYGIPNRVDRLRGLGNAIVPACAVPIFQRIQELESTHTEEVE